MSRHGRWQMPARKAHSLFDTECWFSSGLWAKSLINQGTLYAKPSSRQIMTSVSQDIRFCLRGFRKQPGFLAMAILALGLGIGSATSIFSVVENVLLEPFPYRAADRILSVQVHDMKRSEPGGRGGYRTPEFLELRQQTRVMEEVVGIDSTDVLYTTREGTERLQGVAVTSNTFQFLGMTPILGRAILPEDGKAAAAPVFVMSYKMWLKYCNQDPQILGKTFLFNNEARTLVGIMPPRFTYFGGDIWFPHDPNLAEQGADRKFYFLQGRMKRGVSLSAVEKDFELITRRLAKIHPDQYPEKFNIHAETLTDMVVGRFRSTLMTLFAAVGLLLFIGCMNVANMLLARATSREKEIALRSALGASRWRISRQMLIEAALLASGGLVLGCILAYTGVKALVQAIPENTIPSEAVISLNGRVLLFSLGVAAVTTLLAGLAPALHSSRKDLVEPLKDSGKGVSSGFRRGGLRKLLVVVEIALSLILLAGSGLLMRTMVALQTVDLGLNPDNVLVIRLPLPKDRYKTAAQVQQFYDQILKRIITIPGVVVATETSSLPPYGGIGSDADVPGITHSEKWRALYQLCSEGYFPTIGRKLSSGRVFTEQEVAQQRHVAVVNQTLAKKFFGKQDPIGRQIVLKDLRAAPDPVKDPVFTILGVVSDAKNQGIQEAPLPELMVPYSITASYERGILVRTHGDPLAAQKSIRDAIWSVDRGVALTLTGTMKGYLQQFSYSGPQFALTILSIFAVTGLILVAIGTYSVLAYTVSQQTHEIGIRMALGALEWNVFVMVLRMGGILVCTGLLIGAIASLFLNRLIANQLWGVKPHDPVTMITVIAIIAAVSGLACFIPAKRATRVDPLVALRYE
jgi:putative ABC transport system permease protein